MVVLSHRAVGRIKLVNMHKVVSVWKIGKRYRRVRCCYYYGDPRAEVATCYPRQPRLHSGVCPSRFVLSILQTHGCSHTKLLLSEDDSCLTFH